jgi:hypothetical protein
MIQPQIEGQFDDFIEVAMVIQRLRNCGNNGESAKSSCLLCVNGFVSLGKQSFDVVDYMREWVAWQAVLRRNSIT